MKTTTMVQGAVALTVVGLGAYAVWKLGGFGKGLITGDNALTQNARDADGNRVTAYQGVPVVGTLGAAANAVSGGYLASLGSWIGTGLYDAFNPAPAEPPPRENYDETDRLLKRYPGPQANDATSIFGGWSDQAGIY